jgi:protocatechuate 3,4-dioxygenase beta subunit
MDRTPTLDPDAGTGTTRETVATAPALSDEVWQARGSVRAAIGSAPIAGARVDVRLRRVDGAEIALTRTTSAADGSFAAPLEPLSRSEAESAARAPSPAPGSAGAESLGTEYSGASIVARIEADGFQPLVLSTPLDRAASRHVVFDARLPEGATVRGRAVGSGGQPVPHATVALSIANSVSGPGGLRLLVEGEADGDGRFALGFTATAKLVLSLRADGVGIHSREIDVETRRDRDLGDVVLAGGPPLAGIVLHLDGTPAQELELWAIEGSLAFQSDGFETAVRRAREVERDAGLSWSRALTDSKGRFEFRGLRPDHYAIKTLDPTVVIEPRQARFEPGQTNVELQVQTPLLYVRVTDGAGAPIRGAIVECTDLGVEPDGSYSPGGTRRALTRGPAAGAGFSADPETPLALRARSGRRVSPEVIVFFGQGTQHLEQVLVLAPRGRGGQLQLRVNGMDPADVSMRVALASPATNQRDEDVGVLEADPQGVVAGVPAGEHRLIVDFSGAAGQWCFPWTSPQPVRVTAEETTDVAITPVRGARLQVTCDLVGPAPSGMTDAGERGRSQFGARFVLAPADPGAQAGIGERTLDLVLGDESVYQLLPGETADARDLLRAGDWIVRVEGPHWMPTATRIRLMAGRRLPVAVEVRAR